MFTVHKWNDAVPQKYVLAAHLTSRPPARLKGKPREKGSHYGALDRLLLEIEMVVVDAAGVEGDLAVRAGAVAA